MTGIKGRFATKSPIIFRKTHNLVIYADFRFISPERDTTDSRRKTTLLDRSNIF